MGRKEEAGGSVKIKAAAERETLGKQKAQVAQPARRCLPCSLLGFLSRMPCPAASSSAGLLQSYLLFGSCGRCFEPDGRFSCGLWFADPHPSLSQPQLPHSFAKHSHRPPPASET